MPEENLFEETEFLSDEDAEVESFVLQYFSDKKLDAQPEQPTPKKGNENL